MHIAIPVIQVLMFTPESSETHEGGVTCLRTQHQNNVFSTLKEEKNDLYSACIDS